MSTTDFTPLGRRRLSQATAFSAALALALTACGGDAEGDPESDGLETLRSQRPIACRSPRSTNSATRSSSKSTRKRPASGSSTIRPTPRRTPATRCATASVPTPGPATSRRSNWTGWWSSCSTPTSSKTSPTPRSRAAGWIGSMRTRWTRRVASSATAPTWRPAGHLLPR